MFYGRSHLYWAAVGRNNDRARCRTSRPEIKQDDINMNPITLDGGAILHSPGLPLGIRQDSTWRPSVTPTLWPL